MHDSWVWGGVVWLDLDLDLDLDDTFPLHFQFKDNSTEYWLSIKRNINSLIVLISAEWRMKAWIVWHAIIGD